MAAALAAALDVEVVVTSDRLVPCETPPGSRLLALARARAPRRKAVRFSDLLRLGILAGPGRHQVRPGHQPPVAHPDEYVDLPEVSAARDFYRHLAQAYLA